jgi:carbon monoxide dehydrogenase subunit G
MAVTRAPIPRKSPSQNPTEFFKGVQSGGAHGNASYTAPEKLKGGPMREKIMGKQDLAK